MSTKCFKYKFDSLKMFATDNDKDSKVNANYSDRTLTGIYFTKFD